MQPPPLRSLEECCYEAYGRTIEAQVGGHVEPWDELSELKRDAWRAAVELAIDASRLPPPPIVLPPAALLAASLAQLQLFASD